MDDAQLVVAVRDVQQIEVIDGGRTLAVMIQGADSREIAVLMTVSVADELRVKLANGLDDAARLLVSRGSMV